EDRPHPLALEPGQQDLRFLVITLAERRSELCLAEAGEREGAREGQRILARRDERGAGEATVTHGEQLPAAPSDDRLGAGACAHQQWHGSEGAEPGSAPRGSEEGLGQAAQ